MRRLLAVMGIGCLMSGWGARICAAQAPPAAEERLLAAEKALQMLQAQVDALKAEVARLKAERPAPEKAEAAAAPAGPAVTSVGQAHLFGYMQSQFETGSAEGASRLFLRRVRLGVRGPLEKGFRYEVLTELTASSALLRNAFVDYTGGEHRPAALTLRLGQLKLPYSLEAIDSNSTLPVIERSFVVEQLANNHERDVGLAILRPADPHRPYAYQLSLTNGAGRNQLVATRHKLFAGRVQLNTPAGHPLLGGALAMGFSTRQGNVENENRPVAERREGDRYGLDLDYRARRWQLRSEYLWGRDNGGSPRGYYALAVYRLRALELVGRYEGFRAYDGDNAHRATLGVNYFVSEKMKAMLDYELVNGHAPDDLRSGVRVRLQTAFP